MHALFCALCAHGRLLDFGKIQAVHNPTHGHVERIGAAYALGNIRLGPCAQPMRGMRRVAKNPQLDNM